MRMLTFDQAVIVLKHYGASINDFLTKFGKGLIDIRDLQDYLGV